MSETTLTPTAQAAQQLRALADWLDTVDITSHKAPKVELSWYHLSRAGLSDLARALGNAQKGAGGTSFWLTGHVAGCKVLGYARSRGDICRPVSKGTRHIPEQFIPAHDEEIIEWECGSLLADAGEE